MLRLEDLTKTEMIALFCKYHFREVPQRELHGIIWERMTKEAQKIMEKACSESQRLTGTKGVANHQEWFKWQDEFDRGMKLFDKAERYSDDNINTNQ